MAVGGTCCTAVHGLLARPTRASGVSVAFPSHQVSVDIFKGFPDEESIVNYTLNQAYQDNVTVFASMSLGPGSFAGAPEPWSSPAVPQAEAAGSGA